MAELPKRTCYEEDSEGEESGEESSDASASSGEEGEESGEESSVGDPCSPAKDWREMAIDVDSDDSEEPAPREPPVKAGPKPGSVAALMATAGSDSDSD